MPRLILLSILSCLLCQPAFGQSQSTDVLFSDTFADYQNGSDGTPTWHPTKGVWQMIDGEYYQQSTEYDCATLLGLFLNESFRLEVTFHHLDGEIGVGFLFSSSENSSAEFAQMIRFDGANNLLLGYFQRGEFNATTTAKVTGVDFTQSHRLALQVNRDDDTYSVGIDGKILKENVPLVYRAGYCGLQSSGGRVKFDDVTLTRLPMTTTPSALHWVQRFIITPTGEVVVPSRQRGVVQVFDDQGKLLREFGAPMAAKGQLVEPCAVALLDDTTYVVVDEGSHRLHLFAANGQWRNSTGWKGSESGRLDRPIAVATNRRRQIFVLEQGNNRVQVFNDSLHSIAEFGKGKLESPIDVALQDSMVYVVNAGCNVVECYAWNGKSATWKKSIHYGSGEARAVAVVGTNIYLSVGGEVKAFDGSGNLIHRFRAASIGGVYPWGLAWDRSEHLYVADYLGSRLVITTRELLDPTPSVRFPNRTTAVIEWMSERAASGQLVVMKGAEPVASLREKQPAKRHTFTVRPLSLSTNYHYQIAPTLKTLPSRAELSRRYAFMTPPKPKTKQFVRFPMVTLLFANVRDETKPQSKDSSPPALSVEEIQRIENQIRDGVRFYWVNSSMHFFIDMDFVVVRDTLQRNDVFGTEAWYPPREETGKKYLAKAGKQLTDYAGVLYLACIQAYDTTLHKYVLAGKGGAFTNGVSSGLGFGISWWEVTKKNHNAGNNWLMVHEFNHQLDDVFLASGYPEYWFNHFSPTIGTAAKFGEHFDGNAYILRMVPSEWWFDLKYTTWMTARDRDEDGIPDNAPELPLDEVRLGSDSTKVDTDGDGLSDMLEVLVSNWIIEGWGETYGGKVLLPNLQSQDTDGDGLLDGQDPYPLYDAIPEVRYASPTIDGTITAGEWPRMTELRDEKIRATIYTGWDEGNLYYAFQMDRPVPVKLMVDADADGWFLGRDNYLIKLTPKADTLMEAQVQINNCAEPKEWPFADEKLAATVKLTSAFRKHSDGYHLEVAIPKDEYLGLDLKPQALLSFSVGFLCRFDEGGNQRYVDLFEPNRFFDVRLVAMPGQIRPAP